MAAPTSSRFGATTPNVVGQFVNELPSRRNLVKRAYLAVTTNGSGVATVNVQARQVVDAVATATASGTSLPFTIATISTITATAVSVVSISCTAAGTALAGTAAVTVMADFW